MLSLMQWHGTLLPIREFASETSRAQSLAIERPPYWEYLLTTELLKDKLGSVRRKYDEVHAGLVFRRSRIVGGKEFSTFIQERMNDLLTLFEIFSSCVQKEIPAS